MSYENPEVPHHVNVAREPPLIEFARLAAGLATTVVLASAILYLTGGWLARRIPYSVERDWVGDKVIGLALSPVDSPEARAIERYLQGLVDQLSAQMPLPVGMTIRSHYTDLEVPNAFATLGGHVVVTSGLYRLLPSENALAMVLAHEIAHVTARDPISSLGGGASLALVFALISGNAGSQTPHLAELVQRGYSRGAETRADELGVKTLRASYGHAGGAAAVFEILAEEHSDAIDGGTPSLLSTHPADGERIARLKAAAADWDATKQPLRPLAVTAPELSTR